MSSACRTNTAQSFGDDAGRNLSVQGWTLARAGLMAVLVCVAFWLAWQAWKINTVMSCWLGHWPAMAICEEINGRTSVEQAQQLLVRLAKNPGDSQALVRLTVLAHQPGKEHLGLNAADLLERAIKAAPQNANVLRLQSAAALEAGRWQDALDPLMRLSQHHRNAAATQALAKMVAASMDHPLLRQALVNAALTDPSWVANVLEALPSAQVSMSAGWPLVEVLMQTRALSLQLGLDVIRGLRTERSWVAAQALWLYLWNRPLPFVFNGDFEQAFVKGGLDWEVSGPNDHRSGVQVDRVGRTGHGQVLRVNLSGKGFNNPIVRQQLVLAPGHYQLSGSWQASDFYSEQGLAWVLRCESSGREMARLGQLGRTGPSWKNAATAVEIDIDCGQGLQLALETNASYEARTGIRGEVVFDDLKLESKGGDVD